MNRIFSVIYSVSQQDYVVCSELAKQKNKVKNYSRGRLSSKLIHIFSLSLLTLAVLGVNTVEAASTISKHTESCVQMESGKCVAEHKADKQKNATNTTIAETNFTTSFDPFFSQNLLLDVSHSLPANTLNLRVDPWGDFVDKLRSIQQSITNLRSHTHFHYISINGDGSSAGNYNNDGAQVSDAIALGSNATAGSNGTSMYQRYRGNPFNGYTNNPSNLAPYGQDQVLQIGGFPGTQTAAPISIGAYTKSNGAGISLGYGASTNIMGVAIGALATADSSSISIGAGAFTQGNTSIALGRQAAAIHDYSIALGNVSAAADLGSLAMGHSATAKGYRAIAIGAADIRAEQNTSGNDLYGDGEYYAPQNLRTFATGDGAIAFGATAQATGTNNIAFGSSSVVNGNDNVAMGHGAQAQANQALAFGFNAIAGQNDTNQTQTTTGNGGVSAVAIGSGAHALGDSTLAIGAGSQALASNSLLNEINSLGQGQQQLDGKSIAIGDTSSAIYDESIAIGANAQAGVNTNNTSAQFNGEGGIRSVAIGSHATTTFDNSVAIGSGSVTTVDAGVQGYDIQTGSTTTQTTGAWQSTAAAVAVGNGTQVTRQITGVAAGTNDTDAVNVAQLKRIQTSYTGDNTTTIVTRTPSQNLQILGGASGDTIADGIKTIGNENGSISIQLAQVLNGLKTVGVGNITINSTKGIDAGNLPISHIPDTPTSGDQAVNRNYVWGLGWELSNNGNSVGNVSVMGNTVNFKNGKGTLANTTVGSDKSFDVSYDVNVDGKTITINKSGQLVANASESPFQVGGGTGKPITINSDNNQFNIIGAADGDIITTVNGNNIMVDLNKATKTALKNAQNHTFINKATLGEDNKLTLDYNNDTKPISVDLSSLKTQIKSGNNVTITGNGTLNSPYSVNVATTSLSVGNGAVNDPDAGASQDLVTAGNIVNVLNGLGIYMEAQSANPFIVNPGGTVNFTNGDNNILVSSDGSSSINFNLSNQIHLTQGTISGIANNINFADAGSVRQRGSNAASLNDVLRMGWILQANGKKKLQVNPYSTVNFENGNGTTISIRPAGPTAKVKYDVNVDGTTIKVNSQNQLTADLSSAKTVLVSGSNTTLSGDGTATNPYKVNVADMHVKSGAMAYNDQGEGTLTLTSGDGTTTTITGVDNTFVNKATLGSDNKLSLTYNNGQAPLSVDLSGLKAHMVAGSNTTLDGDGTATNPYKVNVADMHVKSGAMAYNDQGEGTLTLTSGDGTTTTITGVDNTFVNKATLGSDNKLSLTYNNGQAPLSVDLSGLKAHMVAGSNTTLDGDGTATNPYKVNVADMHVKSGAMSYNDQGEGTLTLTSGDGTTTTITGVDNTFVNKATLGSDNKLSLAYNNGQAPLSVDLSGLKAHMAAGTNTTLSGNGTAINPYKVNVEDMHVKSGAMAYNDQGAGTLTLTSGDGTKTTITGVDNTFVNKATLDSDNKLSLTYNNGQAPLSVDLSGLKAHMVAGTNTTLDGDGTATNPYKVNVADMHVKSGAMSYNDQGEGTLTLTSGDGTKTAITGVDNTFVNKATLGSDDKLSLDYNNGQTPLSVDLSGLKAHMTAGTNTTLTGNGTAINPYKVNVADMHVKSGAMSYNDQGEGTLTLTSGDGTKITITGVDNTFVNKATLGSDNKLSLTYNNGQAPLSVDLSGLKAHMVAGTNTTLDGDGTATSPYKVNVADMHVKSGAMSYNDQGEGTLTLTSGDGTTTTITGVDNTFINKATLGSDNKLSLDYNNGQTPLSVDLSGLKAHMVAGTNTTLTGNGTQDNPFIVNVATTPLTISNGKVMTPATTDAGKLATAGDIAKALNGVGFNIEGNGASPEFISSGATVNFVNGNATTATVSKDGTTPTVKYDIAVDNDTIKIENGKLTATVSAGDLDLHYKANSKAPDNTVSLAEGLNFMNGANTTAKVEADGKVTYSVNPALTNIKSISNGTDGKGATITLGSAEKTVDVGGSRITNVGTPTAPTDAVNKGYVDGQTFGLSGDSGKATTQLNKTIAVTGVKDNSGVGIQTTASGTSLTIGLTEATQKAIADGQKHTQVLKGTNVTSITSGAAKDGAPTYTVNVDDMRVKSGTVSYSADGAGTATLQMDGTHTATITGLKDTYVNGATFDASKDELTLNHNDGKNPVTVDLSGLKAHMANGTDTTVTGTGTEAKPFVVNVVTTPLTVSNGKVTAPTTADAGKLATAGDIAKALNGIGFNIEGNGASPEFISSGATVNFVNGNATTATVSKEGTTPTVKYDVAVDNDTIKIENGKLTATVSAGDLDLHYKANSKAPDNSVSLPEGLNFMNGANTTAKVEADGKVTYSVNPALTNIKSISNGTDDKGATITLGSTEKTVDVGGSRITNVGTPISGTDAVNKNYVDGQTFGLSGNSGKTTAKLNSTIAVTGTKDGNGLGIQTTASNTGLTIGLTDATQKAIADGQKHTQVLKGANVTSITVAKADNGAPTYTVNVADMRLKSGTVTYSTDGAGTATLQMDGNHTATITGLKDTYVNGATFDASKDELTLNHNDGKNPVTVDLSGLKAHMSAGSNTTLTGNGTKDNPFIVNVATTPLTVSNGKVTAPTAADAGKLATAGDIAKALNGVGFNIEGNGASPEFISSGATVNFVNGNATTATVSKEGTTPTVKYDVVVDNNTIKIENGKLTATVSSGDLDLHYKANSKAPDNSVSLAEGLNFMNGANTTAKVEAGGKVTYSVNPVLTNIKSISNGTGGKGATITLGSAEKTVDVGGSRITNVGIPTADSDAVNKGYVDGQTFGLSGDSGKATTQLNKTIAVTGVKDNSGIGIQTTASGTSLTISLTDATQKAIANGQKHTQVLKGTNVASITAGTTQDGAPTYKVNVDDMRVKSGTVTYSTDGVGTATLQMDGNHTATITGLKDTYVNGGSFNPENDTLTLTHNDNSNPVAINLSGLRINIVNGDSTTVEGNGSANDPYRININTGDVTITPDGKAQGPSTLPSDQIKTLKDNLNKAHGGVTSAENALNSANKALAGAKTPAEKQQAQAKVTAAQNALKAAQDALTKAQNAYNGAGLNKVATAQSVADAINHSGFNVQAAANGGELIGSANKTIVHNGALVKFEAGKNLQIQQNDQNFTYSLNPKIEVQQVTVKGTDPNDNGVTITSGVGSDKTPTLQLGSQNKPVRIANVADGTAPNDAVNHKQLEQVAAGITNKAINFGGDSGKAVSTKLGDTLNIQGGVKDPTKLTDGNIGVVTDPTTHSLKVKLAKDLKDLSSVQLTDAKGKPNIKLDGQSGTIAGLTNTKFDPNNINPSRAATEGEVNDVYNAAKVKTKVTAGKGGVIVDNIGTEQAPNYQISIDPNQIAQGTNIHYRANGGTVQSVSLDTGFNFTNGTNTTAVVGKDGNVTYNINPDLSGINSISNGASGTGAKITLDKGDKNISVNGGKVTGVADGTVAPNSTDAVNGKQLYQTQQQIVANKNAIATNAQHIADNASNIASNKQSIAQNMQKITDNSNKIAQNTQKIDQVKNHIDQVAGDIDKNSQAIKKGINIAGNAGNGDQALGSTVNIVGSAKAQDSSYSSDNITTTYTQDKDGNGTVKVEMKEKPTFKGVEVTDSQGKNKVSISTTSTRYQGDKDAVPTVSLSGGTDKNGKVVPVRIEHVADGVRDDDAANMGQVRRLAQGVSNGFTKLSEHVNDVDKHARAGIASAGAIATLPQAIYAERSQVAAAVTQYRGQSALAIGYSTVSDNSKWTVRFTGSTNTQKDTMVGVGAGYSW